MIDYGYGWGYGPVEKRKGRKGGCGLFLLALLFGLLVGCGPIPAMARTLDGKVVHNPCTDATVDQVSDAQDVRAEAVSLRNLGNYEMAAAKYLEAADMLDQTLTPLAASCRMNAIGCLLGVYQPVKGYVWDEVRGPKNAQKAYDQMDKVKEELDRSEQLDCDCAGAAPKTTRHWYETQTALLKSQVDREK